MPEPRLPHPSELGTLSLEAFTSMDARTLSRWLHMEAGKLRWTAEEFESWAVALETRAADVEQSQAKKGTA